MKNTELDNFGKIPPQSIDLEEKVIGCIFFEPISFYEISGILKSEMFYKSQHQEIYTVIYDLVNNSKPIDLVIVTEELRRKEKLDLIGGPFYLTNLMSGVSSVANITEYALVINQKFIAREIIRLANEVREKGHDDTVDISDTIDYNYSQLDKINNSALIGSTKNFTENIKNSIESYEKRVEKRNNNEQIYIPTGLSQLDNIVIGWDTGLIIAAARPSVGKTAFALFLAKEAAKNDFPVDIFSLETSSNKLTDRLVLGETKINPKKYKKGESIEWQDLESAIKKIEYYDISINDEMKITINYILSVIRKKYYQDKKTKAKKRLYIIDYLQLMEGEDKSNKNNEVGSITRALKIASERYSVPIILLSQLNRELEKRGVGKLTRHKLSDLRDSGNIEQDADMVIFYSRDRYDIEGNELDLRIEENRKFLVDVAKNREGELGLFECYCNEYVNNFYEKSAHVEPDDVYNPNQNIEPSKEFNAF